MMRLTSRFMGMFSAGSSGRSLEVGSLLKSTADKPLSAALLDIYRFKSPLDLSMRLEAFSEAVKLKASDNTEREVCDEMTCDIVTKYHSDIDGQAFKNVFKMGVNNSDFTKTMAAVDMALKSGMLSKCSCGETCEMVECIAENREGLDPTTSLDYKTVLEKLFAHLTAQVVYQPVRHQELTQILNAILVHQEQLTKDLSEEFVSELNHTVLFELNRIMP